MSAAHGLSSPNDGESAAQGGLAPPTTSGGLPFLGHLLELRRQPIALMQRVYDECGEIGEFRLANSEIVLMTGAGPAEAFFRAPDEQLDQAAAYPFMKPIFGPGVVFDLPVEQRKQTLRTQALQDKHMRRHAEVIARETEQMCDRLGPSGEIDLLDFFGELTTYTSTSTLIGREFRDQLAPVGKEFAKAFQDLEKGTDALAYVNPYLPLPSFRRRDKARLRLVELITTILEDRKSQGMKCRDLLQVMDTVLDENGERKFSRSEITGMIIGMMLAGHHTSQATASWALIELLRNPECSRRVVDELDDLYADGREVSHQALREIPLLEGVIKETLRLHPPLIILMRKVMYDFHYGDVTIEAGKLAAVSPAVSNRLPEVFPDPHRFDIDRYSDERREDAKNPWTWIPFGAGRHKCVGSAFAVMQMKAIFSILLRRYEFEFSQPAESYVNDHSKMVVQLKQPCRVRYQRREVSDAQLSRRPAVVAAEAEAVSQRPWHVVVDLDLCQGHAVCTGEAPEVFALGQGNQLQILVEKPGPELRRRAEKAVRYCPSQALRIVEE